MKKCISVLLAFAILLVAFGMNGYSQNNQNTVTVSNAGELLIALQTAKENTVIYLHSGEYRFYEPVSLNGLSSVTVASYPGETAVIGNSVAVNGWRECTVNGKAALCAPMNGKTITSLFNGEEECTCARYPEQGYYFIEKPDETDTYGSGQDVAYNGFYAHDISLVPDNITDVRVNILHQWVCEVDSLKSINVQTGLIKTARYSGRPIAENDRYFLENLAQGMHNPGDWYCNSEQDTVYYLPKLGETAENVNLYGAYSSKLFCITDCTDLHFAGIRFACTGFAYGDEENLTTNIHTKKRTWKSTSYQGGTDISGAIEVITSQGVNFTSCDFENIGSTAVRYLKGSHDCSVKGCYFHNLGGSALYIGGEFYFYENAENHAENYVKDITVHNCEIANYGLRFSGACGITLTYCDTAEITHNEIHDGCYTGISVGYTWLFFDNPTQNIHVADNLLYRIGLHTLSDMGGIYLLGVQKGTVVENNVIHDVCCYDGDTGYCGNGIYLDSGCQYMTVRNNLVYNCSSSGFFTTLSKDNTVYNNIFALNGLSGMDLGVQSYMEAYTGLNSVYRNNIIVTNGKTNAISHLCELGHFNGTGNILWDATEQGELYFALGSENGESVLLQTAKHKGLLGSAVVANPGFTNALQYDFSFVDNSFAVINGFCPFDYRNAGTLQNTLIGCCKSGGQTAWNQFIEPVVGTDAQLSVWEKIKQPFVKMWDAFILSIQHFIGIQKENLSPVTINTDIEQRSLNENTQTLQTLFQEVKSHSVTYRVDETRKPFADDDRIQAIYFNGESYNGRASEVFAYIGIPEGASKDKPVPAIVLVHGGGVHAQADWVQYWVDNGYAAVSFDGFGQQPIVGEYSASGNNNPDWVYNPNSHAAYAGFGDSDKPLNEQWYYYYLSDMILSYNLLSQDNRILSDKIGISGISWGGIGVSTLIGYDNRFAFAIPIYGCGYCDLSASLIKSEIVNQNTIKTWEPSLTLQNAQMPTLFINGDADPFFSAECTNASAYYVQNGSVLYINGLAHGAFKLPEAIRFANEITGAGAGNIRITGINENGKQAQVSYSLPHDAKNATVTLYYRTAPLTYSGLELTQSWQSKQAISIGNCAVVSIPEDAVMYYIAVSAKTGSLFSSETITSSTGIYQK